MYYNISGKKKRDMANEIDIKTEVIRARLTKEDKVNLLKVEGLTGKTKSDIIRNGIDIQYKAIISGKKMIIMDDLTKKGVEYLDILPQKEKSEAVELLKKLVIAWDPDFTKLTEQEKKELEEAKEDKEYFDFKDVYNELMSN